jgi:arylsulfatase
METYAAMIAELDAGVGEVIVALEDTGRFERTLIVFASDNGASAELVLEDGEEIGSEHPVGSVGRWASLGPDWAEVSNTPYRFFKNDSFEGGTASPLILHWPNGIKAQGRKVQTFSHLIDIHPTLADVAGMGRPMSHGMSLRPLFEGRALPPRSEPVFNQWQDNKAVWDGRWKLVAREGGPWQLYDLGTDPHETSDQAGAYPELVASMAAKFDGWLEEVSDEKSE